jgi:clan AA aspartic protease
MPGTENKPLVSRLLIFGAVFNTIEGAEGVCLGHVMTKITLKNLDDTKQARKGRIAEDDVRQVTVTAMVDTGATTLIINRDLFEQLGLDSMEEREITFANDAKELCKLTDPVVIYCNDRSIAVPALVVEEASEVLLGAIPLEGMDFIVDPVNQRLVGAHGDHVVYLAK